MPPPMGKPEKVATSIQAWATGGFTTCLGGDWACAVPQATATANVRTAEGGVILWRFMQVLPCAGAVARRSEFSCGPLAE